MRILVAGELNVDLILRGYCSFPAPGKEVLVDDLLLTLGSASAICASGLARLGNSVSFLGKIGPDLWGEFCLESMTAAGVDVSRVIRDSAIKTGMTVSLTSAGDRALVTYPGSIEALRLTDVPDGAFDRFNHLHVSSFYLQKGLRSDMGAVFAAAANRGLTTSLDPGFDPAAVWGDDILDVLESVDLFFPNEVELRSITGCGEPLKSLQRLSNGRTLTVAKLGSAGCMALREGQPVHVKAPEIEPLDTTGAGDSFDAGFLHTWLRGNPLEHAMRFAVACGALSTRGLGGTGAQPRAEEAESFMTLGVL
ncbi:MAG: carbohydrate kinase family protein [Bryobacteraceae bacterium]